MKIELIEKRDRVAFEMKLQEIITGLQNYYEIIDIKYSTCFDNTNCLRNYSAIIIFKDKVGE